jgi:hypothetical protein
MNDCIGSSALQTVCTLIYHRGVRDGLARKPAPINPFLAEWAPMLVRAYADGYHFGTRHRPARHWSFDRLVDAFERVTRSAAA